MYDVGNNSAKKQSQAEAAAGLQKKNEHGGRQEGDQPPEGKGKKASRGVVSRGISENAVPIPKKRTAQKKYGVCFDHEREKAVC